MFKVNNKDTKMTPLGVVLVSLSLTLNIFHTSLSVSIFSAAFIANFEHISHLALVFLFLTLSW